MADYITKIRTLQGDKQYDYNSLANLPSEYKLLHSVTLEEDTKTFYQDLGKGYDCVVIHFENLWCVEGTGTSVSVTVNDGNLGRNSASFSGCNFVNNPNYPSKGVAIIEKRVKYAIATIVGTNSAGNRGSGNTDGIANIEQDLNDTGITRVGFSLSGYGTHTMNAGAIINIYGGSL